MNHETLITKEYYSSTDLALVTAISLWYPIDAIERSDPHKATFIFKRDENFDQLLELYWKGELKVNPTLYFNQLKNIKARLYAQE